LAAAALELEAWGRCFARFAVLLVATRFFDIITPSSESGSQILVIANRVGHCTG
jgi:hypothetical protein